MTEDYVWMTRRKKLFYKSEQNLMLPCITEETRGGGGMGVTRRG